jgi:hypothetical protein
MKFARYIAALLFTVPLMAQSPPLIPVAGYVSSDSGATWEPLTGGTGTPVSVAPPGSAIYASCGTNLWCPWNGGGGGGGSVSITSPSGSLTVSPSPLTGTGTIDLNAAHNAAWTVNQSITSAQGSGAGATLALSNTSGSALAKLTFQSLSGTGFEIYDGSPTFANGFIGIANIAENDFPVMIKAQSMFLEVGSVIGISSSSVPTSVDTGLSRDSAGVWDVGNGTQGDKSGTLKAANIVLTGTCTGCTPLYLNWTFNSGIAATDAAPRFLASHAATISACYALTTASDASTALTFNIFDNGSSIFSGGAQTIAAGTAAGTLTTLGALGTTAIANNDKFSINITSGTSSWIFTVQCK